MFLPWIAMCMPHSRGHCCILQDSQLELAVSTPAAVFCQDESYLLNPEAQSWGEEVCSYISGGD
jgi:hypothetical protein